MTNTLSQESIKMDSKKGRTQEIFGKKDRHVMEIEQKVRVEKKREASRAADKKIEWFIKTGESESD